MENTHETRPGSGPEATPHAGTAVPPPPYPARPYKPYYPEDPRRKSPALATLLSIVPGLGQIYIGYYQQGFIHIATVAAAIALLSARGVPDAIKVLFGIFLPFFWMYNLVDAGRRAALYNQALAGLGPGELPEEVKLPGARGSLVGGIVLVGLGALLFAHTRFDMSLEWLEDWWPLALVGFGAYLIYKHVRTRAAQKDQPTS